MASNSRIRSALAEHLVSETAVRITRRSRPRSGVDGFVVALGTKWVVLQRMMDGGFFDGHIALRLSDVDELALDQSFESRFARTQSEWPPALPDASDDLRLNTTRGMLHGLLRPDQIVGIERTKPADSIWIGLPFAIDEKQITLWDARPDGYWDDKPFRHRFASIAAVIIGDHYQRALTAMLPEFPATAFDNVVPVKSH